MNRQTARRREMSAAEERRRNCVYLLTGLLVSSSLLIAGLLFGPFYGENKRVMHWVRGPWVKEACSLFASSVAYRGDCDIDQKTAAFTGYKDCGAAAKELQLDPQLVKGGADGCSARGDDVYMSRGAMNTSRRLLEDPSASDGRRLFIHHMTKHTKVWHDWTAKSCFDAYLVWALVHVSGSGAMTANASSEALCAYAYGAAEASIVKTWVDADLFVHSLRVALAMNQTIPCWRRSNEPCIVALRNPAIMWAHEARKAAEIKKIGNVSTALAVIMLLGFIVHYRLFLVSEGSTLLWHSRLFFQEKQYQPIATRENSREAAFSTHAKQIVDCGLLTGDTPRSTGSSSLRCGGRNIALDFV